MKTHASRLLVSTLLISTSVWAVPGSRLNSCRASLLAGTSIATQARDAGKPEFSDEHALRFDSGDIEKINARRTILERMADTLGVDRDKKYDLNDPAQRVEMIAKSGEFKSWFADADSIAHDLAERDGEVPVLVKPVVRAQEGLLAKLMMIRNAKHTVDLTYYIYESDPSGLSVLNELKDAVHRGVNVRLMVDSLGSLSASMRGNAPIKSLLDYSKKNAGYLSDENGNPTKMKAQVEFVVFNPVTGFESLGRNLVRHAYNIFVAVFNAAGARLDKLPATQWSMNRRSHDKMLVVDALYPKLAIGMFGGRNIADRYFEADPKITDNFVDYETLVRNNPAYVDQMPADASIGHVMHTFYERLYFHMANREVSRGLVGRILGEGQVVKMEAAKQTIETNTAKVLAEIGEDINSPTFGEKYLQDGFFEEQTELISTIANVERQEAARKSGLSDNMQGIRSGNSLIEALSRSFIDSDRVEKETGQAEEVTLISPYIWLGGRDAQLLKRWLLQNPKRKLNIISNSIMTTDNLPAQVLVDISLAQSFMFDEGITNKNGKEIRRSIKDQVTIYAYGRKDSTDLGGSVIYAKLHEKGILFKQANVSAVMTYNQDPRSKLLNSESGLLIRGEGSARVRQAHIDDLIAQSTIWGTDEWKEIRAKMTGAKKKLIEHEQAIYKTLLRLNLWWLI